MRLEVWACACLLLGACTGANSESANPAQSPGFVMPGPSQGTTADATIPTTSIGNQLTDAGGPNIATSFDGGVTTDAGGGVSAPAFDAGAQQDTGGATPDAANAGPDASMAAVDAGDAETGTNTNTVATVPGCNGSTLLEAPSDLAQRGPWPVGEKTVSIGRLAKVEVFYPAVVGSDEGKEPIVFDMRMFLPERERSKVPDKDATILRLATFRDLPLDTAHGPYPVVIFVHGTAAFRLASLHSEALWASRGFVVVAADHPGLYLTDYLETNGCLGSAPSVDLSGDMDAEIAALRAASGGLAFLSGHIDTQRIGLGGHSAGAVAVAGASTKPGVQVVMALAGTSAVAKSNTLKSVLFVAGLDDNVLAYAAGDFKFGNLLYPGSDTAAYRGSPGPTATKKRLIGISKAGHLTVTNLCFKNPATNKSDLDVAKSYGVCGVDSVTSLFDCGTIVPLKGLQITNAATTAVLEETLQCQDRKAAITGLKQLYPEIGDFQEAL